MDTREYLKQIIDEVQPVLSKHSELHLLIMVAIKSADKSFRTQSAHNMSRDDLIYALKHELKELQNIQ